MLSHLLIDSAVRSPPCSKMISTMSVLTLNQYYVSPNGSGSGVIVQKHRFILQLLITDSLYDKYQNLLLDAG